MPSYEKSSLNTNQMYLFLQYSRGGPIILVQVENEFGSYSDEEGHLVFIKDVS